jgi:hypothetical protein
MPQNQQTLLYIRTKLHLTLTAFDCRFPMHYYVCYRLVTPADSPADVNTVTTVVRIMLNAQKTMNAT